MVGRGGLLGVVLTLCVPGIASAACIPIDNAQDFRLVRQNLAGSFCLRNDIDMRSVANFVPLGDALHPFTGVFDGNGHTIRNLRVHSGRSEVGLFGVIKGTLRDVRLAGVDVFSTADGALVGGLAGSIIGGTISGVTVSGDVRCRGTICRTGGVVGQSFGKALIKSSSSRANVKGGNGGAAGGLAGQNNGSVADVYATGTVTCGNNCATGGLIGQSVGSILRAFATGRVTAGRDGIAGGLAGVTNGPTRLAYATGTVKTGNQSAGGLIGSAGGNVVQAYSAGLVISAGTAAGFVAEFGAMIDGGGTYWDSETSGSNTSVMGEARTTAQLHAMPAAFGSAWQISKNYSFPFLVSPNIDFQSALATLVHQDAVFTFVPLHQFERTDYLVAPRRLNGTSLATVFAMIARGIGATKAIADLRDAAIDEFWDDATSRAQWTGPVTSHATLGVPHAIPNNAALNASNVVGELQNGKLVILRGHYTAGGTSQRHWMLATLFTRTGALITSIVAHDPWTGRQVRIKPSTKQVIGAGFPLKNFTVDAYQPVTLN